MFVYDIPVLHLVNRFWIGGAERQFVERLRLHPEGFSAVVGCLEPSGPMLAQVRALGHEPVVFPLKGSMLQANTAVQVARIVALIREHRVRIVHTTDFNTNALGILAARLTGAKSVISRVDLGHLRSGFGKWHREGEKLISNALMEAMAARLPVIATRVGGNPELVHEGENGWLVPYGDARALADRLTRLLRSPDEARGMGRKGRERVEKELTLERMAAGYGALYRRMLGRAPLVREEQASRAA
jgi:hypothetical protein